MVNDGSSSLESGLLLAVNWNCTGVSRFTVGLIKTTPDLVEHMHSGSVVQNRKQFSATRTCTRTCVRLLYLNGTLQSELLDGYSAFFYYYYNNNNERTGLSSDGRVIYFLVKLSIFSL